MGKGTDKLYITHSEWASSDSFSASSGARDRPGEGRFKKLPFNFCAASLQPFKNPVCTSDGTIFDVEVISAWLEKSKTNPVDGEPLAARDLIKLNFARNAQDDLIDPVSYKVFTDNTHIVAVRHGAYANVFTWDTVERMNVKAKMWRDLVDDAEFGRADIITLQDPQNAAARDLSRFRHLKDGGEALQTREQEEERKAGNVNVNALGRIGEKVLRAKEAVEKARKAREAGVDVNSTTKSQALLAKASGAANGRQAAQSHAARTLPANAAAYTTGKAAASFTSTSLTPETSGERALLSNEEWMLKPKRVKNQGYARIETNSGDLTIELHTDTAPKAVWNFVKLAQRGYYDGITFHRNIRNFMIQGGDPTGTGRGGSSIWGKNFEDEFDGPRTHNARGIMSMANKGKNTNSSQFFITYRATKHLDRKHTIFGRVVEGLDVLDKLEDIPTDGSDRPLHKIAINKVTVFIDPFEEFLREKGQKEEAEAQKAEEQRHGGSYDDHVTWTGKRIRGDNGQALSNDTNVGKYLNIEATTKDSSAPDDGAGLEAEDWEQPARKKMKPGGFGNFDSW
ncbi:Peptidyl-prolyl cis-trans isomerase-like 2 [Pyricularia oryzae]|nr:Peptidyl-prolyl cis-trans isomerase-like 2 [Pyricularia oryzae]